MKLKKALTVLTAAAIALTMTACGGKTEQTGRNEIKAGKYEFTKVTDYLFETTLGDYEQYRGEADKFFTQYNPKLGGCSSVQNGMLRGRNYDWTFDEEPEFVIHVPAKDGRHASIGVAATTEITAADVESGKEFDVYKIIPYITLDGINDAGLTVNINVVGYEEMGPYGMKTETREDDVCPLMVPRLLLDRAGSIQEALDLMKTWDIFSLGEAEEAHYMISGPQSPEDSTFNTVVVELIPDENRHYALSVIDAAKGEFVGGRPVMTNFHLTGFDGTLESATAHPMGFERFQVLYENFDQGSDVSGMLDLMKKVYYTRAYDLYNDNFWYSEVTELDMSLAGEKNLRGDLANAGAFAEALRPGIESYKRMQRDGSTWHTVHTSVYDIESRALYVVPQEGGFCYSFRLG